MPIQYMNIHSADSIEGNYTSAPIYFVADVSISWIGDADQICRMNFSNIWGLHGIAYLKSQLDALILVSHNRSFFVC